MNRMTCNSWLHRKCSHYGLILGIKGREGIHGDIEMREISIWMKGHRIRFVIYSEASSWVNQIRNLVLAIHQSGKLLKKAGYKSVEEMAQSILNFIKQYNLTAKAFNWKYAG